MGCICYTTYKGSSWGTYDCYYNRPVSTIVKISTGAPDLSVSEAECEAYASKQDEFQEQWTTTGIWSFVSYSSVSVNSNMPKGCFETISTYDGRRQIQYNTATDDDWTSDCGTREVHSSGFKIYTCLEKRPTSFQTSDMGVAVDKIFRRVYSHNSVDAPRWIQFTYDALFNEDAVAQTDRYAYTINDCTTCDVGTYKDVPGLNKYMSQQEG